MRKIDSVETLSQVITEVSNRILEICIQESTSGEYTISHDDVADLIQEEDYRQYFSFLEAELGSRPEILNLDSSNYQLTLDLSLAWCKNYEPNPGEDIPYGYRELRPASSLYDMAEIGRKAVEDIVQNPTTSKVSVGDLGITEADLDYTRVYLYKDELSEEMLKIKPLAKAPLPYYSLDDLFCRTAIDTAAGRRPTLAWCLNQFGQDIRSKAAKDHPEMPKLMEQFKAFFATVPSSTARRSAVLIHENPAILLTWDMGESCPSQSDSSTRNALHAQTSIMAGQLSSILGDFQAYFTPVFGSVELGNPDEIVAVLPLSEDIYNLQNFEEVCQTILERLALSHDPTWIQAQHDSAMAYIEQLFSEKGNSLLSCWPKETPVPDFIKESAALEACRCLGMHLGQLQSDWDLAKANHDEKHLEHLKELSSFSSNEELLEELIVSGIQATNLGLSQPVVLYTKPPEQRTNLFSDSFSLRKGELMALLPELGYEPDFPVHDFLQSYSFDIAKELQDLLKEPRKPALKDQLASAEQKKAQQTPVGLDTKQKDVKDHEK